uniref:Vitamin K-dependent protein C n=1 Tax=Aceria tosichella TaxID=561515 RepID=A0A6G1SCX4_9ACAR
MDRVSLNGTPVETSAPIFNGDNDTNPTASVADVPKGSVQDKGDEAESLPEDLRSQTAPPKDPQVSQQQQQQQQQQHYQNGQRDTSNESANDRGLQQQHEQHQQGASSSVSTVPGLYSTTEPSKGIDELAASEQQQQQKSTSNIQLYDDHQSRSVYFLSSGVDPATSDEPNQTAQHQHNSEQQDGKHLEQQHKLSSGKSQQAHDLAQSVGDVKLSASQSFDTPLSTTTSTIAPTTTTINTSTTTSRPVDRIVVIHTINGTAYLPSGQAASSSSIQSFMRQHSRPLYANWSDYQQLMMHSRTPQQNAVVYHSNIDPVRRYSPVILNNQGSSNNNNNNSQQATNDLNNSHQFQQHQSGGGGSGSTLTTTPKSSFITTSNSVTETPDPELKVLKDQHSAGSRQSLPSNNVQSYQDNERTISTSVPTTTTTTKSPPTPVTAATITEYDTTTTSPTFLTPEQAHDESVLSSSATEQNGDPASSAGSVSGIASFLGTLFDSFMSSSSSTADSDGQNEARAPLSDSTGAPSTLSNSQQNDRRLGLDLSFRQQNELSSPQQTINNINQSQFQSVGGHPLDGDNLMTSDGTSDSSLYNSQQDAGQQQLPRCNGYCSLDQFLHLCDSHYSSSDCGRSQKCCVTSVSSNAGGDQQQVSSSSQQNPPSGASSSSSHNQICRGTCLPIYHSSLCMKPNEIQLDSINCLPSQLCCSQPSSMIDGNNHLEDSNGASDGSDSNHNTLAHQHQASSNGGSSGVTDGSFSKDQSLSVALVPPPPPTIGAGMVDQQAASNRYATQTNLAPQMNQFQLAQSGLANPQQQQQQYLPTSRPQASMTSTTKSNNQQQSQTSGGGIMNQIFQMFKSNTGLTKQRPRQQQSSTQAPMQVIYDPQVQYHRQIVNYNNNNNNNPQQMIASASNLGPAIHTAPNQQQQQLVYSALQHQAASNGQAGPILLAPNGQPFVATLTNPQAVTNYQALVGNGQNRNKQQLGLAPVGSTLSQQADQTHPYITDPMQYAAMLQKQYSQQPAVTIQAQQTSKQPVQQTAVNQLQMHSHPSQFLLAASEQQPQQQQLTLINAANQMNYMNHHQHLLQQQQQQQQNQNRVAYQSARPQAGQQQVPAQSPLAGPQVFPQQMTNYQQQPSSWTYSAHLSQPDQTLAGANAQQQQPAHKQQQQQQQPSPLPPNNVKRVQHQNNGPGSMSFGPADAATAVIQQSQPNFKPVVGHSNNRQQYGWTGTTSTNRQQDQAVLPNDNMEHQHTSGDKRMKPIVSQQVGESSDNRLLQPVTSSRPNNPEADADVVSAMTDQQQSPADMRPPQQTNTRLGPQQPQQQVKPASYLPKIVTTSTTTTTTSTLPPPPPSPPAKHTDQHQSSLSLSSSNLRPIHAPTDDDGVTVLTDSGDDSESPVPTSIPDEFATTTPNSASLNTQAGPATNPNQANDSGDLATTDDESVSPDLSTDGLTISSSSSSSSSMSTSHNNMLTDGTSSTVATDQNAPPFDSASRSKVVTTACGLPGPNRLDLRLNSVSASRARAGRVMGGFESEPGYWCWQAALMNGKNEYLCGGALIGTKWVLTAAHCVTQHLRSESQLYVRLGQSNLNTTSLTERRAARNVLVKTSYVHHNHNGITLDNDIALLRLDESVDLGEPNICTICLPERNPGKQLEPGRRCTVTGYGYETEQGPAALRVRQTDLPLVGDQECQTKVSATLQKPFVLPASSFCAGGEPGQDACHGDGGSPLSCLVDGYYVLEGLVSWGYGCGKMSGLFAKVSNFVGWINQIVSVNS